MATARMLSLRLFHTVVSRVRIAKATIASEHVGYAHFERAILAIPIGIAIAQTYYCAPGCHISLRGALAEQRGGNDYGRDA